MFFGVVVPPSATAGHLRHPNVPKPSAGPSPILCLPFLRFCRRPHAIVSPNVWVKLLRTILSLATRKRFSQLCPVRALLSDLNISDALCVLRERLSNWIETHPRSVSKVPAVPLSLLCIQGLFAHPWSIFVNPGALIGSQLISGGLQQNHLDASSKLPF